MIPAIVIAVSCCMIIITNVAINDVSTNCLDSSDCGSTTTFISWYFYLLTEDRTRSSGGLFGRHKNCVKRSTEINLIDDLEILQ